MFTLFIYLVAFVRNINLPIKSVWYVPIMDIIILVFLVSRAV